MPAAARDVDAPPEPREEPHPVPIGELPPGPEDADSPGIDRSSWWHRDTDFKGLVVTVLGLVLTAAGLGLALWAWKSSTGPGAEVAGEQEGGTASVGARVLPEHVIAGPVDLRTRNGGLLAVPERRDVYGVPRISDSPQRRWCGDGWCQYDFPFTGARLHSADTRYDGTAQMYVAQVFPEVRENAGVVTASSFSATGEGAIVVDVPFANGWVCYRMTVAFGGSADTEPIARTPWSTASCFLLDEQGYVIRGENRS